VVRPISRRLLGDTIQYAAYESAGRHGGDYAGEITVTHTRIVASEQLSVSARQRFGDATAVLVVDTRNSSPVIVPKAKDRIEHNGITYIVDKVLAAKDFGTHVHHYEASLT
jgi:hypothetical protein